MIAAGFKIVARNDRTRIACFGESPVLIDRMIFGARGATSRVVFMGRLHYRAEPLAWLRSRGGGVEACRTNDAALCAALYVEGGVSRLERLEGDFVLVVVDDADRRLIALRSPLGIYPLFWTQSREEIVLSTSIRPLAEHLPSLEFDDAYAADFLASPLASVMEVPAERCAYRGVRRLLPGHLLEVRTANDSATTRRYWEWRAEEVKVWSLE